MKNYFSLILLNLLSFLSFSQQGEVHIIKDNRIDSLVTKQSTIIPPASSLQISGYRIQLFFDTERDAVDKARSKFIAMYPKIDTYIEYNAPNYFLKVGNFRTHLEAEKVKASVEQEFLTSFIVKEMVNLPRLD